MLSWDELSIAELSFVELSFSELSSAKFSFTNLGVFCFEFHRVEFCSV